MKNLKPIQLKKTNTGKNTKTNGTVRMSRGYCRHYHKQRGC